MKIKHKGEGYGTAEVAEIEIADLVEDDCDGSDYNTGSLETAHNTAIYTSQVLGRLIDKLTRAKLLTADDVTSLLRNTYKNPELVD